MFFNFLLASGRVYDKISSMQKAPGRDPLLEVPSIRPQDVPTVKKVMQEFRECLVKANNGKLRTADIETMQNTETGEIISYGLRDRLDNIGGPETIHQTQETIEGLAQTAKILTEIQTRISACRMLILDEKTESITYKFMLGEMRMEDPNEILPMPLRQAIKTYLSPHDDNALFTAFETSWGEIAFFEHMREPKTKMTPDRAAELRAKFIEGIKSEAQTVPAAPPQPL